MHVSELARQVGVPAHVVRYYTQAKLLRPRRDPKNSYRQYADSDVVRLRFIRRAKWLGLTLGDVRAILGDVDRGVAPCPEVREIIKHRAYQNRERLDQIMNLQQRVEKAMTHWESLPDRPPSHTSLCHLIDAVADSEGYMALDSEP